MAVELPATDDLVPQSNRALTIELDRRQPAPPPLSLFADDELIATITAQDHADIQAILDTGLDLALTIDWTQPRLLRIRLPPIPDGQS